MIDKLKEIKQLQNNITLDDLEYTAKRGKHYVFIKYSLAIIFLRDMHEGHLSLEEAGKEQIQLVHKLKTLGKGKTPFGKRYFLKKN